MKSLNYFHDNFLVSNKFLFFIISAQLQKNFTVNNSLKKQHSRKVGNLS